MAETQLTPTELERQAERRRAAMATPVADEGDVAFGGMVGIAVLAAILAAIFAFVGFGLTPEVIKAEAPEVTVERDADEGPDRAAILAALGAAGYDGLQLSNDGGVVTARGEVADEAARAEVLSIIGAQPNVTEVIDELNLPAVVEPDPPAPEAAAATVTASADEIVLSGTVPSEAAAAELRQLAATSYEPEQIVDNLEILADADPATVELTGTLKSSAAAGALQGGLDGLGGFTSTSNTLVIEADAGEEINAILELEPILFQSGTAIILPESQATIDEAIRVLTLFPEASIEIGGHTDSLGPDEANRALSEARAQAVLAALQSGGVANQLTAVGYGESQLKFPDDKGDSPDKVAARQANRRIEFTTLN